MQFFGFEISRKKDKELGSVVAPPPVDGSTVINTGVNAGGYYGMVMDVEGVVKNENDLIRRYREVAQYSDCDSAIEDIVNEAIVVDDQGKCVKMNLDDVQVSDAIKKKIQEEFHNVLKVLRFEERSHDIFRSWYIDGRLYYQILIDEKNMKQGIVELRYIDPRKIRRIKNVVKEKNQQGVEVIKSVEEFYLFNDKGITEQTTQGVKLSIDSVVYVPSGCLDANTGMMMSYLHKAIKAVNQALGRVIRHIDDYGCMILIDNRYEQMLKKGYFSKWLCDRGRVYNDSSIIPSISDFFKNMPNYVKNKILKRKDHPSKKKIEEPKAIKRNNIENIEPDDIFNNNQNAKKRKKDDIVSQNNYAPANIIDFKLNEVIPKNTNINININNFNFNQPPVTNISDTIKRATNTSNKEVKNIENTGRKESDIKFIKKSEYSDLDECSIDINIFNDEELMKILNASTELLLPNEETEPKTPIPEEVKEVTPKKENILNESELSESDKLIEKLLKLKEEAKLDTLLQKYNLKDEISQATKAKQVEVIKEDYKCPICVTPNKYN